MKVKFEIDTKVITKQLKEYKDSLAKYIDAVVKGICGVVKDKAQSAYGRAVKVTVEQVSAGKSIVYKVIAQGEAVVFLEFGAGDRTDGSHPYGHAMVEEANVYIYAGSYSESEGTGEYAQTTHDLGVGKGYWHLKNGGVMHYVEPRRALFNAVYESEGEFLQVINANKAIINSTVVTESLGLRW